MSSDKVKFLIAMPSLESSIFSKSVILMVDINDKGALGFIVNLPTGTLVKDALKLMKVDHIQKLDTPIFFGGPVQTDFFWAIHSSSFVGASTIQFHKDYHLSSAQELMPLLNDPNCPEIHHAGVGYSGWGAKQLDKEIEEGSWWLDDFNINLIFETDHSKYWEEAFKKLGVNPSELIDPADTINPTIN